MTKTVEANTRNRAAGWSGEASVHGRVAPDEPTARIDHYVRDSKAVVLHHRHLPGNGSEISHLIVGPCGVTVVDSRTYEAPSAKLERSPLRGSARRRSDLVKPVLAQVDAVRDLLADTPFADVPIEAALARRKVVGARVLQGLNAPRVIVCGARTIAGEASREGPVTARHVKVLAAYLDNVLG